MQNIRPIKSHRRERRSSKKKQRSPGAAETLTLDEAVAAVAVHLGEVDEEKINNMAYVFFQEVVAALGKKLNFESVSNLYGRTVFDKKGGKSISEMIEHANPLYKPARNNSANTFLSMPGQLKVIHMGEKYEKSKAVKALGDTSWFEEFLK